MASNTEAIGKCLLILSGAFRVELDDPAAEAYHIGLEGLTPEQLSVATKAVLQSSEHRFMPTPGQLRQAALTGGGSFEGRADIAWHEFDRCVASHGGDHSVSFADGLINATVALLGGWIHCCEKAGDDYFIWLQKTFKATYVRLCEAGRVSPELLRPHPGRYELANAGFPNRVLDQLAADTGRLHVIGTSQPVIAGPAEPAERRQRLATSEPLRIGQVLAQTAPDGEGAN